MSPEQGRRFFIGIGVATAGGMFRPLPGVAGDLARMRALFEESLAYEIVQLAQDLSAEELRSELTAWVQRSELGPSDSVVFYFSGHGYVDIDNHYLCTRGFRKEAVAEGLRASDLATLVLARSLRPGKVFLILDCCYASRAAGATLVSHAIQRADCYLLTASAEGPAYDGQFSSAFVEVARLPSPPQSLDRLVKALEDRVGTRQSIRHLGGGGRGQIFDFLDRAKPAIAPPAATIPMAPGVAKGIAAAYPALPSVPPAARQWKIAGGGALAAAFVAAFWYSLDHSRRTALDRHPAAAASTAARAMLAPETAHSAAGAPQSDDSIVVAGARMQFGLAEPAARALFDECRKVPNEDCGKSFEDSVFGRSVVAAGMQIVPRFALDAHEVSNLRFARYLDGMYAKLQAERWQFPGVLLRDAAGRRISAAAKDGSEVTPYGIARVGQHLVAVSGREAAAASYLSWYAADGFCSAAGERLPNELEWELAARGSEGRTYPWPSGDPNCQGVVFVGQSSGCPSPRNAPADVGTAHLDVSPLGLMDLAGNVLEWTTTSLSPVTSNDRARCADDGCVIARGGSYRDHAVWLNSALRSRFNRQDIVNNLGFRCAKDLP